MSSTTEIDGSVLEGGGQILRIAMALSSLLKKSIKVRNIRANRAKTGLRPQHLKGLEVASEMCNGTLSGAAVDRTEITYQPGELKSGRFEVDTQTAGSIAMLMQVAIPIALFGTFPTYLKLKGGTDADMAPPVDYTINAFLPVLKKFGGDCICNIRRRGFYPRGGGIVDVQISPVKSTLSPVSMTAFGSVTRIWGTSFVAGVLPVKIAHDMADAAQKVLDGLSIGNVPVDIQRIQETPETAFANGCGITLFAETSTGCILGASALGKKGVPSQQVGTKAGEELAVSIKGQHCVDSYMQDQVIILMTLADGKSTIRCGPVTLHTKTAIHIAEKLTNAKFKIEESPDYCTIECDGIGFKSNSS